MDKDGNPTYRISHGRDGRLVYVFRLSPLSLGLPCLSWPQRGRIDYAPALAESLKTLSYSRFRQRRHQRPQECRCRQRQGHAVVCDNVNVMCYIDDIYVYLRARANDAIPGGRPPTHEDKPEAAKQAETSCTGIK